MTRSFYLLGAPGVGKSSVMRELLRPWNVGEYVRLTEREMFGHHLYDAPRDYKGVYLGHLRPEFPGTDALSMSVQPEAIKWLRQDDGGQDFIFGEGARLGNAAFLEELALRSTLTIVLLTADPETVEARLQARPDSGDHKTGRTGRSQDKKWREGQATRCRNAVEKMAPLLSTNPRLSIIEIATDQPGATPPILAAVILGAS